MTEEREKENQGRDEEAKDPEREGGLGPRESGPPGQEDKPDKEDEEEAE